MFVMDHEIAEADEFDGRDTLMRAVEKMLHLDTDVLRKHFLNPFAFHGAGEAEQCQVGGAASWDFADGGSNEKWRILDHAFADQCAGTAFGQIALQAASVATKAELVNEASHDTAEQGSVVGFFVGLKQLLLLGN